MKKPMLTIALTLTFIGTAAIAHPAMAVTGPHGCVYSAIMNKQSISTFCPHYAPYEAHQAVGKIWFTSGYSKTIQTPITAIGRGSNAGRYHGGQVFDYWQNRW